MVNNWKPSPAGATRLRQGIGLYVLIVAVTLVALVVLSVADPDQATQQAWTHQVIVAAFAVVLPLRLRRALDGDVGALRAVGIISGVLVAVNIVEALLPGAFPVWMRVEMVVLAVVLLSVVGLIVRERVVGAGGRTRGQHPAPTRGDG